MGHLAILSSRIKDVLTGVSIADEPAFVDILERASNKFSGFPSATIVPGETNSDYSTTDQNQRTYVFFIYVYLSAEALDGSAADIAWANIRDIIDLVLDSLDRSDDLDNACEFLHPVPMQPFETAESGSGAVLVAPIRLECIKTINL
jgi:hypothetical protein